MIDVDADWIRWRDHFSDHYDDLNYSSGLQAYVMKAGHRLAERPFDETMRFARVLEIGAGTGVHFDFVRHQFDTYEMTDGDREPLALAERRVAATGRPGVSFAHLAGDRLPYPDQHFDRLIATHVLEHIPEPWRALAEWNRVIRPGGDVTILIPTDPGLTWRLGRHLGPRRNAVARGIAYDYIMAREHVNSCVNLIAILRHLFPGGDEAWWPLPIPSVDLNLFFVFHGRRI